MPDISTSSAAYLEGGGKRTTNIGAQVEYRDTFNKRRTTATYLQVEYFGTPPGKRTTAIVVQVEYRQQPISSLHAYLQSSATSSIQHAFLQSQPPRLPAYLEGTGTIQSPTADVVTGSWQNEQGGSVLYTSIFEIDPNDNTYVTKPTLQVGDSFEVALIGVGEGYVATDQHTLEIRARSNVGITITLKVELLRGTQVIASDTRVLASSFETYEYILSQAEIDAIIDAYDDLRIRFTVLEIN